MSRREQKPDIWVDLYIYIYLFIYTFAVHLHTLKCGESEIKSPHFRFDSYQVHINTVCVVKVI